MLFCRLKYFQHILFTSVTVGWLNCWCENSAKWLLSYLGVVSNFHIFLFLRAQSEDFSDTDLWISMILIFGQNRNKNRRGNSILLKIASISGFLSLLWWVCLCCCIWAITFQQNVLLYSLPSHKRLEGFLLDFLFSDTSKSNKCLPMFDWATKSEKRN